VRQAGPVGVTHLDRPPPLDLSEHLATCGFPHRARPRPTILKTAYPSRCSVVVRRTSLSSWTPRLRTSSLTPARAPSPTCTSGRTFSRCLRHSSAATRRGYNQAFFTRIKIKARWDDKAGVEDLDSSRPASEPLTQLGYLYAPYREAEMHWFCKPDPAHRTHHLHLVPTGSRRYQDELVLRDFLRARPDIALKYQEIKQRLAISYEHDREAYTDGKSSFIALALGEAREGSASE
jgi:hypothetical protein